MGSVCSQFQQPLTGFQVFLPGREQQSRGFIIHGLIHYKNDKIPVDIFPTLSMTNGRY